MAQQLFTKVGQQMLTKIGQQMLTKIDQQLFHTIETDGRLAGANQQMFLTYTIAFFHTLPILLFGAGSAVIPLLFYVQQMSQLHINHPDFFRKFENGYVIRRSNQFWAGLSSDLVIEQTLMRSLKTCGGLTRGSGLSDEQRALWTMSTPISAQYNAAMQEFIKLSYCTSEQHKDLTQARMNRDLVDLEKINSKLMGCSPFSPDCGSFFIKEHCQWRCGSSICKCSRIPRGRARDHG